MSKSKVNVRYVADVIDVTAWRTIQRAEHGSPRALWELLRNAEAFLRGDKEIQPGDLYFIADALAKLTKDSKLWNEAQAEFEKLDCSGFSYEERVSGRGPRIPEEAQRKLGRAFCRAFHLSKPRGRLKKGEIPKSTLLCPVEVDKIERLRLHGVSRRDSIKIVQAAYPSYTYRNLDGWVRFRKSPHRSPAPLLI